MLDERDPFCYGIRRTWAHSFDVAIAGGGIVGAACAAECAAAGLKVVVVEPGPIGGGATAAGMGHIVVMDDSPAQIALTTIPAACGSSSAPSFPPMWNTSPPAPLGGGRRGRDGRSAAQAGVYDGIGVRAEVLEARRTGRGRAASARAAWPAACCVPDDAVIYPPCAARYLLERARAARRAYCA